MRVLVICTGSIGQRHLKNITSYFPNVEHAVLHLKSNKSENQKDGDYYSLAEAFTFNPDAVIIACPATLHIPIAIEFAKKGIHLFIEKPLSHNLTDINDLIKITQEQNILAMVGYNLKFFPLLIKVKELIETGHIGKILHVSADAGQYLPSWRPSVDYRHTVSAKKELGGGVLLELSHEIDYVQWLCGEVTSIIAKNEKLTDLDIDVEDTSEILLKFKNGILGRIHIDMIDRNTTRTLSVIGSEGTIKLNIIDGTIMIYTASETSKITFSPEECDRNIMYIEELRHFFDCIETGKQPINSITDAKNVLLTIESARLSSDTGKEILI